MGKPPKLAEREGQKLAWAKSRGLKEYKGGDYLGLRFLNHGMPTHFECTRFPAQDYSGPHCLDHTTPFSRYGLDLLAS